MSDNADDQNVNQENNGDSDHSENGDLVETPKKKDDKKQFSENL